MTIKMTGTYHSELKHAIKTESSQWETAAKAQSDKVKVTYSSFDGRSQCNTSRKPSVSEVLLH